MKEIKNYDDLKKAIEMTRNFKMYFQNTWGKQSKRYGYKIKRYNSDYYNYSFFWNKELYNVQHYFSDENKYLEYALIIFRNDKKSNISMLDKIYDRINSIAFQREQKLIKINEK